MLTGMVILKVFVSVSRHPFREQGYHFIWSRCTKHCQAYAEPWTHCALCYCLPLIKRANTASESPRAKRGVCPLLKIVGIFMELLVRLFCLNVRRSLPEWWERHVWHWAEWTHISDLKTKCPVVSHLPRFLASHRSSASRNAEVLTVSLFLWISVLRGLHSVYSAVLI